MQVARWPRRPYRAVWASAESEVTIVYVRGLHCPAQRVIEPYLRCHRSPLVSLIQVIIQGFCLRERVQLAARLGLELTYALAGETELTADLRQALGLVF